MDEVSSAKAQLAILLGVKVKQCLDIRWLLQKRSRETVFLMLPAALRANCSVSEHVQIHPLPKAASHRPPSTPTHR